MLKDIAEEPDAKEQGAERDGKGQSISTGDIETAQQKREARPQIPLGLPDARTLPKPDRETPNPILMRRHPIKNCNNNEKYNRDTNQNQICFDSAIGFFNFHEEPFFDL
ncbi:hypothetical protein [Pseudochelatococcus lubricantis]|uniref:hypothetical protein n=1 Tax=Pseudochelatococcus lubricantis TaxID=1538102 RepID=UPI001ABA4A11|nr:hypothetical protein [Pseudochelatococcus lubricantis]